MFIIWNFQVISIKSQLGIDVFGLWILGTWVTGENPLQSNPLSQKMEVEQSKYIILLFKASKLH